MYMSRYRCKGESARLHLSEAGMLGLPAPSPQASFVRLKAGTVAREVNEASHGSGCLSLHLPGRALGGLM